MKSMTKFILLCALSAVLFSFTLRPGGDHYQVYLDDKMVLEQFVHMQKSMPTVTLDADSEQALVSITYSHCGKVGTARNIIIKDHQNKILKEWHFVDVASGKAPMTFNVKDLVALKQKGSNNLNLVYSSNEIPEGRQLATVVLSQHTALK
jgi:hypothetical protein